MNVAPANLTTNSPTISTPPTTNPTHQPTEFQIIMSCEIPMYYKIVIDGKYIDSYNLSISDPTYRITFTSIGIQNIIVFYSNVLDDIILPAIYSLNATLYPSIFFNSSSFILGSTKHAKYITFDYIPNIDNFFILMSCDHDAVNSDPSTFISSNSIPLQLPNICYRDILKHNITSGVDYYSILNLIDQAPTINSTVTILIKTQYISTTYDAIIYKFDDNCYCWIEYYGTSNIEYIKYGNYQFITLKNIEISFPSYPYPYYYLAIGNFANNYVSLSSTYELDISCSNTNYTSYGIYLPSYISNHLTCGQYITSSSYLDNNTSIQYFSFNSSDEYFQLFRFESCLNCSNIFWIYGYNIITQTWELNDSYVYNCSSNDCYDFQFIARDNFNYYLGVSTNGILFGEYYFNVTCSKIKGDISCSNNENITESKEDYLSKDYFLHFYKFNWNETQMITIIDPIRRNYSRKVNITKDINLNTLILSSCDSDIITEIVFLPLNNVSLDTNINILSSSFQTTSNCLLPIINVTYGIYLIGIASYYDTDQGYGEYILDIECINSFPFHNIVDSIGCDIDASINTVIGEIKSYRKPNFYSFTLLLQQNRTIFDGSISEFDTYLRVWEYNDTISNWSVAKTCLKDCNSILDIVGLDMGNYFLEVGAIDNSIDNDDSHSYAIKMSCSEPILALYPIISNITCNGYITGNSDDTYNIYEDTSDTKYIFNYYSYFIDDSILDYYFQYDPCSTDVFLKIYSWNGEEWIINKQCTDTSKSDDDNICGECIHNNTHNNYVRFKPEAGVGSYYLAVLNKYGSGSYSILMNCTKYSVPVFNNNSEDPFVYQRLLVYTLIVAMFILSIISVIAYCYTKCDSALVDDSAYWSLILYGLQIFDFITDINLSYELLYYVLDSSSNNYNTNIWIIISSCGVTIFTLIPWILNIQKAINIKKFVKHNIVSKLYFEQNTYIFVVLVVISGGIYSTLRLLSSHLFGLRILNCGLTRYDLRQLLPLKVFSSVLLENFPQLICQIMYVVSIKHYTFNTVMSTITSILSIIATLISYYIKQQSLMNSDAVVYYLEFTKLDYNFDDLSIIEKQNISKKKGRKKALRYSIAQIFGINPSYIDIGYITLTQNGCIIHCVQYVFGDELKEVIQRLDNKLSISSSSYSKYYSKSRTHSTLSEMSSNGFVQTLYRICNKQITKTLCDHFNLQNNNNNKEYIVNYHKSFPYKFEDNIMNNVKMEIELNNQTNKSKQSESHDNYIRLEDDGNQY